MIEPIYNPFDNHEERIEKCLNFLILKTAWIEEYLLSLKKLDNQDRVEKMTLCPRCGLDL